MDPQANEEIARTVQSHDVPTDGAIETDAVIVGAGPSLDASLDALREASSGPGQKQPSEKALMRSLKKARAQGQDEALREDIAMRKAVDLIVEHAKPISVEQAKAKNLIWTPEKDEAEAGSSELWTPGD